MSRTSPRRGLRGALRLAALGACGVTLGACSSGTNEADTAFAKADADDMGYLARGAQIIETSADGKPRFRLTAATITQPASSRDVEMQDVAMNLADERGARWQLSADSGQMPPDARRIELAGNVLIRGEAGSSREPLEIRTAALTYDVENERATSSVDVTIQLTGKRLEARGLDANIKDSQVRLESKVHGRFTP